MRKFLVKDGKFIDLFYKEVGMAFKASFVIRKGTYWVMAAANAKF